MPNDLFEVVTSNFNQIFFGRKTFDIELVEGDDIYIPKRPGIVSIEGMVNNPGLIKYQKGWELGDYIDSAGGFHKDADKKEIFVYYAGGEAKRNRWFLSLSLLAL